MKTKTTELGLNSTQAFEIIENQVLEDCVRRNLTISGPLLSLNSFYRVSFLGCHFFAAHFKECVFKGCRFENCQFQFAILKECRFVSCTFVNCTWIGSNLYNSEFVNCELDLKTSYVAEKGHAVLQDCFSAQAFYGELNKVDWAA